MSDARPSAHASERITLVIAEYLERRERGEAVSHEQCLAAHPDLANELIPLLTGIDAIQSVDARQVDSPKSKRRQDVVKTGDDQYSQRQSLDDTASFQGQDHKSHSVPQLPETFGRYRVQKLLGIGGMGAVYLAADTVLERQVAIKVPNLQGDETGELLTRFLREARLASNLHHANICPVFDCGEFAGTRFISMAYISGRPLSSFLARGRQQAVRSSAVLVRTLALALQHAHERQVVHRDLKPSNIMIDADKEPLIMDFGLARQVPSAGEKAQTRVTKLGIALGTPAYMSPEQVQGNSDLIGAASDQYSLGVVFYELLTGQLPFVGTVGQILKQILTAPAPQPSSFRPDLDSRINDICLRMLAKRPGDRFGSMQAVADALGVAIKSLRPAQSDAPLVASGATAAFFPKEKANSRSLPPGAPTTLVETHRSILPSGHVARSAGLAAMGLGVVALCIALFCLPGKEEIQLEVAPAFRDAEILIDGAPFPVGKESPRFLATPGQHRLLVRRDERILLSVDFVVSHEGDHTLRVSPVESPRDVSQGKSGLPGGVRPDDSTSLPPVEDGFVRLFNGRDLDGWDGDRTLWKVEHGAIVAETIGVERYSFLSARGSYSNFELRLEFKVQNGNAGVQFRSRLNPLTGLVSGYQADLAASPILWGALFDELRRTKLLTQVHPGVADIVRAGDWNKYVIRAEGNHVELFINGVQTADYTEQDPEIEETGIVGFALRTMLAGQALKETPIRVEFRNVRIRTLPTERSLTRTPDPAEVDRLANDPRDLLKHSLVLMNFERENFYEADGRTFVRDLSGRGSDGVCLGARATFDGQAGGGLDCREGTLQLPEKLLNHRSEYTMVGWFRLDADSPPGLAYEEPEAWDCRLTGGAPVVVSSWTTRRKDSGVPNPLRAQGADCPVDRWSFLAVTLRYGNSGQGLVRIVIDDKEEESHLQAEDSDLAGLPTLGKGCRAAFDELAIFDRALSRTEIAALRRRGESHRPLPASPLYDPARQFVKLRQFVGNANQTWRMEFTPEGDQLLSICYDGQARLFNVETGRLEKSYLAGPRLRALSIRRDGLKAVVGGSDHVPRIWKLVEEGEPHALSPFEPELIIAAAFSPSDETLALGGWDPTGPIRIVDPSQNGLVREFAAHRGGVTDLRFAPDGARLVSCGHDTTCAVWDLQTGKELSRFRGHRLPVRCVAISPDGRRALSGDMAGTVWLWNIEKAEKLRSFQFHRDLIVSLGFLPGGEIGFSASFDGRVALWDTREGILLAMLDEPGLPAHVAAVSPDGTLLATGSGFDFVGEVPARADRRAGDGLVRLWRMPEVVTRRLPVPSVKPETPLSPAEAAVWVLKQGGRLELRVGKQTLPVEKPSDLPRGNYSVTAIDLTSAAPIADSDLGRLASMTSLESLALNGRRLTDRGFDLLGRLFSYRQLKNLTVVGARRLTDRGLKNLASVRTLQRLDLPGAGDRTSPDGWRALGSCEQLSSLNLENTSFDDAGLEALASMKNLNRLMLNGSRITNAGLRHLSPHSKLTEIHLDRLNLTAEGLQAVASLPGLTVLSLGSNQTLNDEAIAPLRAMKGVLDLRLKQTRYGDDALLTLAMNSGLKRLELDDSIRLATVSQLCEKLPSCQCVWRSLKISGSSPPLSLIPSADETPQSWHYTVATPPEEWAELTFSDAGWKSSAAPFGWTPNANFQSGTRTVRPRTLWQTGEIWLRQEFESPAAMRRLILWACHSADAEVYLNGRLIATYPGSEKEYSHTELSPQTVSSLRVGRNILAVHCTRKPEDAQFIDVGLIGVR